MVSAVMKPCASWLVKSFFCKLDECGFHLQAAASSLVGRVSVEASC